MKKTIKVSIGGFAYILDDDAYLKLSSYLDKLKAQLGNCSEAKEILEDVEERISELIAEYNGENEVVDFSVIEKVLKQLGNPEDISGNYSDKNEERQYARPLRRIYRDPEGSIFAGVCSGLGNYFDIDPIVFRILFIILSLAKGFGILLYIIFWIITPRALTPKQRLEMKGTPITIKNIKNNLNNEFKDIGQNIKTEGNKKFVSKIVNVIKQIVNVLARIFLVIIKVIAAIIGVTLILSMLILFFTVLGVLFFGSAFIGWFVPNSTGFALGSIITSVFEISSSLWVTIPIFLILAIPILALIYAGFRILFRFKANDGAIGIVSSVLWVLAVVTLALVVFFQARNLNISSQVNKNVSLNELKVNSTKTLYLKSSSVVHVDSLNRYDAVSLYNIKVYKDDNKYMLVGKPRLIIEKTSGSEPQLIITKFSRGFSTKNARENASKIDYEYAINDTIVNFDNLFIVQNPAVWKNQHVSIEFLLPVGYKLYIDSSAVSILDQDQPQTEYWPDELTGKKWIMTNSGLQPSIR
ncbi:MAG TPA: PspC domain-containing protein [Tenuifilaceae bacterium]|nr:PspC domain-containing protein [Tenuifilaceae bacterium]